MRHLLSLAGFLAILGIIHWISPWSSTSRAPLSRTELERSVAESTSDGSPTSRRLAAVADPRVAAPQRSARVDPAAQAAPPATSEPVQTTGNITIEWSGPGGTRATGILLRGPSNFTREYRARVGEARRRLEPIRPERRRTTFKNLELGEWAVGVRSAAGEERWNSTKLESSAPDQLVVFSAGGSKLSGTIWSPEGVPLGGVAVTVRCPGPSSETLQFHTQSLPDGQYFIEGLYPGACHFAAARAGSLRTDDLASTPITIAAHDPNVFDVGSPANTAPVTLWIVDAEGDPYRGGMASSRSIESGQVVERPIGADGRCQLALSKGEWNIRIRGPGSTWLKGPFPLVNVTGHAPTQHFIHVPGPRILGTFDWATSNPGTADWNRQRIFLREGHEDTGKVLQRQALHGSLSFRFDELREGDYCVTSHPMREAEPILFTVGSETTPRSVHLRVVR